MSSCMPLERVWSTWIPTESGRIQMRGYSTGVEGKWHLALIRRCDEGDDTTPKLWIIPQLVCCHDAGSRPTDDTDELHFEYRRFAVCKYGVTIALSQHPRNLGFLLYVIQTKVEKLPYLSECKIAAGASSCSLKRILKEIGIKKVQLEYPRSNNLQRCLNSCTGALNSCSAACLCALPR